MLTSVVVAGDEMKPPGPEEMARLLWLSVDPTCIASLEARFIWVNPAFTAVLGYSAEELTSLPSFLDLIHPDDVEPTRAAVAELGTGKSVVNFRNRYRHQRGHWVWLEWNTAAPVDGRLYAVARDVTVIRQREFDLERRTQELMMAEEMGGIGHWQVDLRSGRLTWSEGIYRIHGLDPGSFEPTVEEAIARYHPDDRERVRKLIEAAIAQRGGFDFELRLLHVDGSIRFVRARGVVQSIDDEPFALFGTFQDVTDQRRMQERLLLSERLATIGTLAASVGHEINNPLTYVVANLDLLDEILAELETEGTDPDYAGMRAMVDAAQHGALRVRKIVKNLRFFARARKGEDQGPVSLPEVLDSAVTMVSHELRHRARLVREYEEPTPPVLADPARLGQVFVNLLVNAVHALEGAGRREGVVTLRLTAVADELVAEVADNGAGIPDDVQRRIFEPFFTTKPMGVGTGLGLPISQQIVDEFGGTIEVESELGEGTTFRVRLPVMRAGDVRTGDSKRAASRRNLGSPGGRVLIVDDDAHVRRAAGLALEGSFEVVEASDADEALRALERWAGGVDLVVLDIMMPGRSGVELYRDIVRRWPALSSSIVFITGGAFSPETRRFLDELAAVESPRLLEKPFNLTMLRRFVERNLAPRGQSSAPG